MSGGRLTFLSLSNKKDVMGAGHFLFHGFAFVLAVGHSCLSHDQDSFKKCWRDACQLHEEDFPNRRTTELHEEEFPNRRTARRGFSELIELRTNSTTISHEVFCTINSAWNHLMDRRDSKLATTVTLI